VALGLSGDGSFRSWRNAAKRSSAWISTRRRLVSEFGVQYRPYRERVLQIINDIRKEEGLPEVAPR